MMPQSDPRSKKVDRAQHTSGERLHEIGKPLEDSPIETAHQRWVTAGIGLAVLLTVVMSTLTGRSINQAEVDADWVTHTHQVQSALQAALRSAVDIETGARGFAATGEGSFLKQYGDG